LKTLQGNHRPPEAYAPLYLTNKFQILEFFPTLFEEKKKGTKAVKGAVPYKKIKHHT